MGGLGGEAWKEAELEQECGMWVPKRNEVREGAARGARSEMEGRGHGEQVHLERAGARKPLEFCPIKRIGKTLSMKAGNQGLGRKAQASWRLAGTQGQILREG